MLCRDKSTKNVGNTTSKPNFPGHDTNLSMYFLHVHPKAPYVRFTTFQYVFCKLLPALIGTNKASLCQQCFHSYFIASHTPVCFAESVCGKVRESSENLQCQKTSLVFLGQRHQTKAESGSRTAAIEWFQGKKEEIANTIHVNTHNAISGLSCEDEDFAFSPSEPSSVVSSVVVSLSCPWTFSIVKVSLSFSAK